MATQPRQNEQGGSPVPVRQEQRGPVLDAEVIGPEGGARSGRASDDAGSGWEQATGSGARYWRVGGSLGNGGTFGRVWTATGADGAGCLAPCITFALFFVCVSQFGLLAGIGFAVFHLAGSIAGSIRAMGRLVEGRPVNPWTWRLGNWFVSFMLTSWLAGGFH